MRKARNSHSPSLAAVAERGGRVDMALDKMSSQPGADLECSLEIDAIAGSSGPQVGSVEGFRPGLDLERLARGRHDGQAATAHGHALAELERFAGGKARPRDRQAPPAVFVERPARADPILQPVP